MRINAYFFTQRWSWTHLLSVIFPISSSRFNVRLCFCPSAEWSVCWLAELVERFSCDWLNGAVRLDLYFVWDGVEQLCGVFLLCSAAAVPDEFVQSHGRDDQRWNARQDEDDDVNPVRVEARRQRREVLLSMLIRQQHEWLFIAHIYLLVIFIYVLLNYLFITHLFVVHEHKFILYSFIYYSFIRDAPIWTFFP